MDNSKLKIFGGSGVGGASSASGEMALTGMDKYSQIHRVAGGGSDSDDSRSSISRSDDNEGIPSIIYTSDDSADVGRSDSTCMDSDGLGYIAQHVQIQDDGTSGMLLLDSECPSPQPSPQPGVPCFTLTHPLAVASFTTGSDSDLGPADDLGLGKESACDGYTNVSHLTTHLDGCKFERSTSISSTSSGSSPEAQHPLLPEYQPLADYTDFNEVEYGQCPDLPPKKMPLLGGRCLVGKDVHISAQYQDACFVSWNWDRIRQSCVVLNLSLLLALLCVGVGLLIQMPKGSECNPEHAWWQGSVFLEVHVPSFKDSDGDNQGDLSGLLSNINHIQSLGVQGIRVSGLWESKKHASTHLPVTPNLTHVDPALGNISQLQLLASHLHQLDLHLLLDLPLSMHPEERGISLEEVYPVLKTWLTLGIDGFFFPDITKYANDPALIEGFHEWRNILDQFTRGMDHKVMMAPITLLDTLTADSFPHLDHLIHQLDLINIPVNLSTSAETISEVLEHGTAVDSHASLPWINWNMAKVCRHREGGEKKEEKNQFESPSTLGRNILLLFFPGTITLCCCDELQLLSHELKMNDLPTVDLLEGNNKSWRDSMDEETYNKSLTALTTMITKRQEKVPMYINGIFDYVGDYHPKKTTNYRVRYADNELIILDRFYPRRNQYAVVANLGTFTLTTDLSNFYYGGSVLASSHGHTGYVTFRNITLQPGEALACVLDL